VDEDTRAIEREILVEREELSGTLRELESHARQLTDWRRYYRKHTGAALGATFGAGMVAGLITRKSNGASRRSTRRVQATSSPESWEPGWEPDETPVVRQRRSSAAVRGLKNLSQTTRAGQHLADTAAGILNALLGVVSAKAVDVVSHLVPGFRDEYHSRRGVAGSSRYGDSRF
jgi:hypothetical protein